MQDCLTHTFILPIDPKHSKEHAETSDSEDTILVVSDVDACLYKEKTESDQAWCHEKVIEVKVSFILVLIVIIYRDIFVGLTVIVG